MCGRYAFFSPAEAVKRTFALDDVPELEPRYNIAPTQDVPAIRAGEEGARAFVMLHWGLVPKWAKERAIGNRMINARSETLAEKPSFRDAFRKRRCLVLADGWYEWQVAPGGKQPWFVRMKDGAAVRLRRPVGAMEGSRERRAARVLHHRDHGCCPVDQENPRAHARGACRGGLGPLARHGVLGHRHAVGTAAAVRSKALEAWQVSREVNAPKNQGPELIASAGLALTSASRRRPSTCSTSPPAHLRSSAPRRCCECPLPTPDGRSRPRSRDRANCGRRCRR